MRDFIQALLDAIALVGSGDPELVQIVVLSLRVSLSASVIAMVIGAPLMDGASKMHVIVELFGGWGR